MSGPFETEIKLRVQDGDSIHNRLESGGFGISKPRVFESNTLFDTPASDLRNGGKLLRLRRVDGTGVLTYKGPVVPGPHKIRPEIETAIDSVDNMEQILLNIGYQLAFRYEKYRTEYTRDGRPGVVTVDETPIGWFVELEGPPDWIDNTAKQLGFTPEQYILDSYGRLYLADCERRGVQPSHMVFAVHAEA